MKITSLFSIACFALIINSCSEKQVPEDADVSFTADQQPRRVRGYRDPKSLTVVGSVIYKDSSNAQAGAAELAQFNLHIVDSTGRHWEIRTMPINKLETKTYRSNFENTRQVGWKSSESRYIDVVAQYLEYLLLKEINDYSEITITAIHDGMVDGTFSCQLSNWFGNATKKDISLANGVFKNIRIANN